MNRAGRIFLEMNTMPTKPPRNIPESNSNYVSDPNARAQKLSFFVIAVLGFSFWFFMAVPFASHRESYWWLGMVQSHPFATAFSFISKTYRPLAQGMTWLGFLFLDPRVFPTSVLRQTLLQGFIYAMFVLAWWIVYSNAPQQRLFAFVAFVSGGVFFSGYVQLFHIYGVFYVPVILTLAALLRLHSSNSFDKHQTWFAVVAILLAFWHPFATALFIGYYFGFYLDTFPQRSRAQHARAVVVLLVGIMTIVGLVVLFPTMKDTMSLGDRLFGFLVSYQTNEVNIVASIVAFLLTQFVVLSISPSPRLKLGAFLLVSVLSGVMFLKGLPLLLLWPCAALVKLIRLRCWSLFFLVLTATMLPFGGGIGTPIYALFSVITAVYVTSLGWSHAERALSFCKTRYAIGMIVVAAIVVLMVRVGIKVPIVTGVASPLLSERERTFQLENVLAWLHNSNYCGCELAFAEDAGNPVDSLENVMHRENRPPSSLEDVRVFWKSALQCPKADHAKSSADPVTVTFGGQPLARSRPIFGVRSRYAGDATVWVEDSGK